MTASSTISAKAELERYIDAQEDKGMLRFITCGSVDDGKSTLIGRLLWDSKLIFDDQLAALEQASSKVGTQGDNIDFALLLDGLQAEREQGITIDVAYRFFSTDKRKFIVADTPGHEQYTRNMATGASSADVAVILINAEKGILTQTMRHSYIVSLVGIRKVILAVNKMDAVDFSQTRFEEIRKAYGEFSHDLGFDEVVAIPLSALKGDNVIKPSANMSWFDGPTILGQLETVDISSAEQNDAFRFPVQWVNRSSSDFRGFAGTVAGGKVQTGDPVLVPSSGQIGTVARIVTFDGDIQEAVAGQAVTIELEEEIEISRGELLSTPDARPDTGDQFEAKIIWMNEEPLLPGRRYLIKLGTSTVPARVTDIKYKVNVNTLEHVAAKTLSLNEIGICNIALERELSFDPYAVNRTTGSFILIDWYSNATLAAGSIDFPLRRASNIHRQFLDIDKKARAEIKRQRPMMLWFTGLSGAGKSTIANIVEQKLHERGKHTYILDGDNVRHGLNKDLGFTDADRVENIRRVAETAKMMIDAGIIVLASFISPFRSERQMARDLVDDNEFWEVFVETSLDVCEERDIKGLYKKARAGEIANFTGIDSAYEPPENAEIRVDGGAGTPEDAADKIVGALEEAGVI